MRILIVDDDASLRLLYEQEFREEGYEVLTAASGEEALDWLAAERVDAMILDVRLNGMSGLEVLRQVLASHPGIRVVLNSAYSVFKGDFGSWSADAYVVKSSDSTELKEVVRDLLRRAA